MGTYFLLYSYVYLSCSSKEVLLINLETNDSLVVYDSTFIDLCIKLSQPTIYYVLDVTNYINDNSDFSKLLEKLEESFWGEIVYSEKSNIPIQFSPDLRINNNRPLDNIDFNSNPYVNKFVYNSVLDNIGRDILTNVFELTIYYSSYSDSFNSYSNKCNSQYLFPVIDGYREKIKNLDLLFKYNYPCLSKINFVVGDLDAEDLIFIKSFIRNRALENIAYLYVLHDMYEKIDDDFFDSFSMVYIWSCKFIDLPNNGKSNKELLFLVENDLSTIYINEIENVYPVYNGENRMFIKKFFSFDKMDLIDNSIDDRYIFMNQYLNSNFYGELSIYPNGDIFSRKNTLPLGNIKKDDIKSLILNELLYRRNWFFTRKRKVVCRNCAFNCICPPVTYVELEMGCCFCMDDNN